MSGTLPAKLSNLQSIVSLYIDNTQISGVVPDLGNFGVEVLKLGKNRHLSGTVPDVSGLFKVTQLELHWNR